MFKQKEPVKYSDDNSTPRICIIGGGIGGICQAIQLKRKLGLASFDIIEKENDFGGVWLKNIYPGCALELIGYYYCLSFEPNSNWKNVYPTRDEILKYVQNLANKYDLYSHAKFCTFVESAHWKDDNNLWEVSTKSTADVNAVGVVKTEYQFIIMATGKFREPNIPKQFDSFSGPKFHSARWNYSIQLEKKIVGVVGCGSTAMQVVPEVAKKAKKLVLYNRSPSYVLSKPFNLSIPWLIRLVFRIFPCCMLILRMVGHFASETLAKTVTNESFANKFARFRCNFRMRRIVKDKNLHQILEPKYKFGCRVFTLSDSYYRTLNKSNVSLNMNKVTHISDQTIFTEDGQSQLLDVLIFCTGYKVQDYFAPIEIIGTNNTNVLKVWKESWPKTFYGITCNYTPNMFFILGPNAVAFGSHTYMIESQIIFICNALAHVMKNAISTIQVRNSAVEDFLFEIKEKLKDKVWVTDAKDCTWALNSNGECTFHSPYTPSAYWKKVKKFDQSKFEFKYRYKINKYTTI